MPSPFPGMDPYLESPLHWRDVHHRLAVEISRRLAPRLATRYVARLETRLVAFSPGEEEIRILYPDVKVTQRRLRELAIATVEAATAAADAVPPPPLVLRAISPEQVELITVEIRDAAQGRLVSAIEILSPVRLLYLPHPRRAPRRDRDVACQRARLAARGAGPPVARRQGRAARPGPRLAHHLRRSPL
jgi:hypothetical protein